MFFKSSVFFAFPTSHFPEIAARGLQVDRHYQFQARGIDAAWQLLFSPSGMKNMGVQMDPTQEKRDVLNNCSF